MSKSDGFKLPKSVAGVKIPKAFRKAGLLDALVATPETRQLLADAIVAAAHAAAAAIVSHAPPDAGAEEDDDAGDASPETPPPAARRRFAGRKPATDASSGAETPDQAALPSAET